MYFDYAITDTPGRIFTEYARKTCLILLRYNIESFILICI